MLKGKENSTFHFEEDSVEILKSPFSLMDVLRVSCYLNVGSRLTYRTTTVGRNRTPEITEHVPMEDVLNVMTDERTYEVRASGFTRSKPVFHRRWIHRSWQGNEILDNDETLRITENTLSFLFDLSRDELMNANHCKVVKLLAGGDAERYASAMLSSFNEMQFRLSKNEERLTANEDAFLSIYGKTRIDKSSVLRLGAMDRRGFCFDVAYDLPLFYGESCVKEFYRDSERDVTGGVIEAYEISDLASVRVPRNGFYSDARESGGGSGESSFFSVFSSSSSSFDSVSKRLSKCISMICHLENVGHTSADRKITAHKEFKASHSANHQEWFYNVSTDVNLRHSESKEDYIFKLEMANSCTKFHSGGMITGHFFLVSLKRNASSIDEALSSDAPSSSFVSLSSSKEDLRWLRLAGLYHFLQCNLSTSTTWVYRLDYSGKKPCKGLTWVLTTDGLYYSRPDRYHVSEESFPGKTRNERGLTGGEGRTDPEKYVSDTKGRNLAVRCNSSSRDGPDEDVAPLEEHEKDCFLKTQRDLEKLMNKRKNKNMEQKKKHNVHYTSGRFDVGSKDFGKPLKRYPLTGNLAKEDKTSDLWYAYSGDGIVPTKVSLTSLIRPDSSFAISSLPRQQLSSEMEGNEKDPFLGLSESLYVARAMENCGKTVLLESDRTNERWPNVINPFVLEMEDRNEDEDYRNFLIHKYDRSRLTDEEKKRTGSSLRDYEEYLLVHEKKCVGSWKRCRKNNPSALKDVFVGLSSKVLYCIAYEFMYAISNCRYALKKMKTQYGPCDDADGNRNSPLDDRSFDASSLPSYADDDVDMGYSSASGSRDYSDDEWNVTSKEKEKRRRRDSKKSYKKEQRSFLSDVLSILVPMVDANVCTKCAWKCLPCDAYNVHPLWIQTALYVLLKNNGINFVCMNPPNIPSTMDRITYMLNQQGLQNRHRIILLGYHDQSGNAIYDIFSCYWEFYESKNGAFYEKLMKRYNEPERIEEFMSRVNEEHCVEYDDACERFHVWRIFDYYGNCLNALRNFQRDSFFSNISYDVDPIDPVSFETVYLANAFFFALEYNF